VSHRIARLRAYILTLRFAFNISMHACLQFPALTSGSMYAFYTHGKGKHQVTEYRVNEIEADNASA
jgi:hypothetical protein